MKFWLIILYIFSINIKFSQQKDRIVDATLEEDKPDDGSFTTIQACINDIGQKEVGVCQVKEGRYHEIIDIQGKKDVTVKGHDDNEKPPVIDGTVQLTPKDGKWEFDSTKKYCYGEINQDVEVFQLFYGKYENRDMMTNARWPNALWKLNADNKRTVFDEKYWGHSTNESKREPDDVRCTGTGTKCIGTMYDDAVWANENGFDGLADSGLDMTGAMAVLNIGSFNTFVKPVKEHKAKQDYFTYEDDFDASKQKMKFEPAKNRYYIDSKLNLLDQPGEWYFEKKILYFLPFDDTCANPASDDCKCPDGNSDLLWGRVMDYSMIITDTTEFKIKNIDFFASTIKTSTRKQKPLIELDVDTVNFSFPSSSRRMLKDSSVPKPTTLYASNIGKSGKKSGNLKVTNCVFKGAEGFALIFQGSNTEIYNNLFEYNDWSGQMSEKADGGGGTVVCNPGSSNSEFVGNTLSFNGAAAGYRPGKEGIVRGNIIEGQCHGKIMNDGSGVQVQVPQQTNTELTWNWAFNSPKYALRFDGAPKVKRYDEEKDPEYPWITVPLGRKGTMSNNVQWDSGPFQVKGDEHTVSGNLALGHSNKPDLPGLKSICILREYTAITNQNTNLTNNAFYRADGGSIDKAWKNCLKKDICLNWNEVKNEVTKPIDDKGNKVGREMMSLNKTSALDLCGSYYQDTRNWKWDLAGNKKNNYIGDDLRSLLVDVDNRDFRPRSNDKFTDDKIEMKTGEQIGPYETEQETITYYAIPGRKEFNKASHPIPGNGKAYNGDKATVSPRNALMFRPGFRCASHTAFVSAVNEATIPDKPSNTCEASGKLPCKVDLSITDEYNSKYENVINVDAKESGEYKWRVDCKLGDGKDPVTGEEWKFTV